MILTHKSLGHSGFNDPSKPTLGWLIYALLMGIEDVWVVDLWYNSIMSTWIRIGP